MRIQLAPALFVSLLVGGCDDDVTKKDMAGPPPDMSASTSDSGGCPTSQPVGVLVFASVTGSVPSYMAGFSGTILSPVVTFNNDVKIGGCDAAHYDAAHPAPRDADAGLVTITKYPDGKFASGMMAPAEIDCLLGAGDRYLCGYGPPKDGKPGPLPNGLPFAAGEMPLPTNQVVQFKVAGGGCFGSFDSMAEVHTSPGIKVTENLDALKYDPAADLVIHYTCDGGSCKNSVIAVNIVASPNEPGKFDDPTTNQGTITCTNLDIGGTSTSITVSKDNIKAMLGGDATLKTIRTVVLRTGVPNVNLTDSRGNGVKAASGQGVVGFAAR